MIYLQFVEQFSYELNFKEIVLLNLLLNQEETLKFTKYRVFANDKF